ncbi:hypothetical protein, partial [Klebsiella pneumoniae]|uniref:hypothetical protein n=1 Tax=Klebsiella pneumoniae TaxID=573 RepID=UPI00259FFF2C
PTKNQWRTVTQPNELPCDRKGPGTRIACDMHVFLFNGQLTVLGTNGIVAKYDHKGDAWSILDTHPQDI